MEKVLIIGCKKTMNDICVACSRCMVAFNRREGAFEKYKKEDAELIGMLNCGDCPGAGIVNRMAQLKHWNHPIDERVTAIHIGPCIIDSCPHRDEIIAKVKEKAGVDVVEGGHTFKPVDIFFE